MSLFSIFFFFFFFFFFFPELISCEKSKNLGEIRYSRIAFNRAGVLVRPQEASGYV